MSRITNIQPKNNNIEKEVVVAADCKQSKGRKEMLIFEVSFQNALTIEESRKRTLQHLDELWEKSR